MEIIPQLIQTVQANLEIKIMLAMAKNAQTIHPASKANVYADINTNSTQTVVE